MPDPTCPTCHHRSVLDTDGVPCGDAWHLEHGTQLEREVAAFMDAERRTNETLSAPAPEHLASLVGVPEGVGPAVRPDCPICTGGRGLPCPWH